MSFITSRRAGASGPTRPGRTRHPNKKHVRELTRSTGNGAAETVRPLLKWAGGKRQLLPHIRQFYPATFRRYLEPFVGSGAVFFDLYSDGHLADRPAVLMDNNADLIGCYQTVRDHTERVIRNLSRLAAAYEKNPREHYYAVRDDRFNPARKRIFNGTEPDSSRYTPSLAAMLIYLNRTGFNGLFRLNSQGLFNVPLGRYTNPRICDAANLSRVAAALDSRHVRLAHDGFEAILDSSAPGDFIYLDPPYAPLSRTAHFTSYTATRFSDEDQERLQRVVIDLANRRCWVLLSNIRPHRRLHASTTATPLQRRPGWWHIRSLPDAQSTRMPRDAERSWSI